MAAKPKRHAIERAAAIAKTMALSATEHSRGGRAVAQSDRRSRTANSGGRLYRRRARQTMSALSRLYFRFDSGRSRFDRQTCVAKSTRTQVRGLRECPAGQSPRDVTGEYTG